MECPKERRPVWAADDGLGRLARFGLIYYTGLFAGLKLVFEDVLTVTRTPLQAEILAREGGGPFCGVNDNLLGSLLGLDAKKIPPITVATAFFLSVGLKLLLCGLSLRLLHIYGDPLRSLIWRSRRRFHAFTRRLLAWVCSLSALIVLMNNTSTCFGLAAFSSLTICAVGLFNFVADPDDGIAMARWVIEQSVVVAFLVAVAEGGASAFFIRTALLPVPLALLAIVVQKITVLVAKKELLLPAAIAQFFYNKELSQYYTPKSEHVKSWAIDIEYQLEEDTNNSSSMLYLPLLQQS